MTEEKREEKGSCVVVEPLGDLCGRAEQFDCGHPTFVASLSSAVKGHHKKRLHSHIRTYAHRYRFGRSYGLRAGREIDMRTQE